MKKKLWIVLCLILGQASMASAKCFLYQNSRGQISLSRGVDFEFSRDWHSHILNIDIGMDVLKTYQRFGTCPAVSEANQLTCFKYKNIKHRLAIGTSLESSHVVTSAWNQEDVAAAAEKLQALGQCTEIVQK